MESVDKSQPWRWRCPDGHTGWKSRQSGVNQSDSRYYCETCRQNGDNPHFEVLRDAKQQ